MADTEMAGAGCSVLLLEDDPLLAELLGDVLLSIGVDTVQITNTISDYLAKLSTNSANLSILDHRIGRETSIAAAQTTMENGIPVIMITGREQLAFAPQDGRAFRSMTKPASPEDLLSVITELHGPLHAPMLRH